MKEKFVNAIKNRQKLSVTFFSKEDRGQLTRICAPMDFGTSRRSKDGIERYHLWDYTSDEKSHTLSLKPDQIISMIEVNEFFNPSDFVSWQPNWIIKRDWGRYS